MIWGLTHKSIHVENPVEGVDLSEGGDVHWEAAVGEHYSEHGERESVCAFG